MLNVIPTITTKKMSIEYTHKEMRTFYYKNQLNTKEGSNVGNEGQKTI